MPTFSPGPGGQLALARRGHVRTLILFGHVVRVTPLQLGDRGVRGDRGRWCFMFLRSRHGRRDRDREQG